jgi:nucleoside-diphosphate-sugar epimerase
LGVKASVKTPQPISGKELWQSKKVLITGAGGFLGSQLCRSLIEIGVTDITCIRHKNTHHPLYSHCNWVTLDLLNRAEVMDFGINKTFDVVVHAAGKIDQSVRADLYQEQFLTHVTATLNLLDSLAGKISQRFIHIGSNAEYGNAACPHAAETREMPNSAYGVSKLAASKLVLAKVASEGLPAVVVRPFLIYGPNQNPGSFLSKAISAARQGLEFPTSYGEQTRDFVPVEKVCSDILEIAMDNNASILQVVNSCTGIEIRLKEILEMLQMLYPDFQPKYGAVPYRDTELFRSVGIAYQPLSREECWERLKTFLISATS